MNTNNNIDLSEVYNANDKGTFLKQYKNLNTKRAFVRIFKNTFEMEDDLQKDLYYFTKEELEKFFENTTPTTPISARNYGRMIIQYIAWAVEQNIISDHPFPVQQHYFLRYVKPHEDEFLTIKELRYFTHYYFQNFQDGVILELLFNGVQGKEGSELCNLTLDDFSEDELSAKLIDSTTGRERTITFEDEKVIQYCKKANAEEQYDKRNSEIEPNPRIRPYTDLAMDTNSILKNSKTHTTTDNATKYTIYNRLKSIQKFKEVEEVKHKITIKNIVKSGQLYMASKLYEKDGRFDLPQLREICQHFGAKEHWTMRDYLNEENILKYYPHLKKSKEPVTN
jgi:integrase